MKPDFEHMAPEDVRAYCDLWEVGCRETLRDLLPAEDAEQMIEVLYPTPNDDS